MAMDGARSRRTLLVLLMAGLGFAACHRPLHAGRRATGGSDGGPDSGTSAPAGGHGGAGGRPLGGAGGTDVLAAGGTGAAGHQGGGTSGGAGGVVTIGGAGGTALGGAGGASSTGGRGGAGGGAGNTTAGGQSGATSIGGSGGPPAGGTGGALLGGAGGPPSGGAGGQGGATGGTGGNPFTGLGGQLIGGTVTTDPIGPRPPDWTPPFVGPMGAPGWAESTTPICAPGIVGYDNRFDVWADERGVFALLSKGCSDGFRPCTTFDVSVQVNRGAGWQPFHDLSASTTGHAAMLGGFPRGPLVLVGSFAEQVGMAFLDEQGLTFQGSMTGPAFSTSTAMGGNLAYAFEQEQMFKYSAGTWSKVGEPGPSMSSVWTDGQTVVAVGADQTVLMGPVDGALTEVANVPAGDYTAVWGFAENDLWLSNGAQLVHFDGSTWQPHDTGVLVGGIHQLWGDAGVVYFASSTEFGRWNGADVEILLRPPAGTKLSTFPGSFGRFWGRTAREVFLPLNDARYKSHTCSSAFILYFDGARFHPF